MNFSQHFSLEHFLKILSFLTLIWQAALRAAQSGAPATEKTETPLISSYGA